MKIRSLAWIRLYMITSLLSSACMGIIAQESAPPGTVIEKSSNGRIYLGAPSILVLPNGEYLSSHHLTGPDAQHASGGIKRIHVSADKGKTWSFRSELKGQFWSSLFLHQGNVYLIGTRGGVSDIVIRRSTDGGRTWTEPSDDKNGLLLRKEGNMGYHCAPVPVVFHKGRIWRAFEYTADKGWGNFDALMMSINVDDDLLDASKWTASNKLPFIAGQHPDYNSWLEGNAVVSPDGHIIDMLRVHHKGDDIAAMVRVSEDGKELSFDPATGFVNMPGACKKFTIHFDPESKRYWSLTNYVPLAEKEKASRLRHPLERARNSLVVISSKDLVSWEKHHRILYSPEILKHGFQYADWKIDGKDIVAVVRTSFGENTNPHDANHITFHRIKDFRKLTKKRIDD